MKKASDQELTINGQKVKASNLDKIFWLEEKITKGDLIAYYCKAASYILPYLADRPQSLNRHPDGIFGGSFFQKDVAYTPRWVKIESIWSESNEKHIHYLVCKDEAHLIYMANLGCIEMNPWFSRVQHLDNPDYAVLDLDPLNIDFKYVIQAAQVIRKILKQAGVESYCKTSGATGLHVYIPLGAKYDYEQSKRFMHIVAVLANKKLPKSTSIERVPNRRRNKVYLDYLQNRKGQTLACPYSVRPKPGATVSAPLKWSEVTPGLDPAKFTIKTIFARIKKTGDLFKPVLQSGIDIRKALKKLA